MFGRLKRVLEAALRQLRSWQEQGLELTVSVNLSARDLLDLQLPEAVQRPCWRLSASA